MLPSPLWGRCPHPCFLLPFGGDARRAEGGVGCGRRLRRGAVGRAALCIASHVASISPFGGDARRAEGGVGCGRRLRRGAVSSAALCIASHLASISPLGEMPEGQRGEWGAGGVCEEALSAVRPSLRRFAPRLRACGPLCVASLRVSPAGRDRKVLAALAHPSLQGRCRNLASFSPLGEMPGGQRGEWGAGGVRERRSGAIAHRRLEGIHEVSEEALTEAAVDQSMVV